MTWIEFEHIEIIFVNISEAKINDFDVEAIKNQARHFNVGMIKYSAAK